MASSGEGATRSSSSSSSHHLQVCAAMDEVGSQCSRRGLHHSAVWLSQLRLDATPSVLSCLLRSHTTSTGVVSPWPLLTLSLDVDLCADATLMAHHRLALSLLELKEYMRCHHHLTQVARQRSAAGHVPSLPSALQFMAIYALYLDGEKTKFAWESVAAAGGGGGGGGAASLPTGAGGPSSAAPANRRLRELRSLLHVALATSSPPAGGGGVGYNPDVASSSHHRPDPYLLWLMSVVLRSLQAPAAESSSFLFAALSVNPFLRCAWEDLERATLSERDVVEAVRRLGRLRPAFMLDIFSASVRTALSSLPMAPAAAAAPTENSSSTGVTSPTGSTTAADGLVKGPPGTGSSRSSLPPPSTTNAASSTTTAAVQQPYANAWELLLRQFPSNPFLMTQLAEAMHNVSHSADQAQRVLAALTERHPYFMEHTPLYSNLLFLKRDTVGLCALAQRVHEVDTFRAETQVVLGNYYFAVKDHERSIIYFQRAIRMDPTATTAWTLLGQAYLEHKKVQAALQAFRFAVNQNPRDYRGWYNLGHSYELLGVFRRARHYYARAAQLRPADPRMWRAIASCYRQEKQNAAALECLESAEVCLASHPQATAAFAAGGAAAAAVAQERLSLLEELAEGYRSDGLSALRGCDFLNSHTLLRRAVLHYYQLWQHLQNYFSDGTVAASAHLLTSPGGGPSQQQHASPVEHYRGGGGGCLSMQVPVVLHMSDAAVLSAKALCLAFARGETPASFSRTATVVVEREADRLLQLVESWLLWLSGDAVELRGDDSEDTWAVNASAALELPPPHIQLTSSSSPFGAAASRGGGEHDEDGFLSEQTHRVPPELLDRMSRLRDSVEGYFLEN